MHQIVLAKVEMTGLRDSGELVMRDRNWFPKFERCPEAKACMWLNRGTESDVQKAREFATTDGWEVFVFPSSESDPLGKARKLTLENHGAGHAADHSAAVPKREVLRGRNTGQSKPVRRTTVNRAMSGSA